MKSRAKNISFNALYNHLSPSHIHTHTSAWKNRNQAGVLREGCEWMHIIAHLLNSTESSGKKQTMSILYVVLNAVALKKNNAKNLNALDYKTATDNPLLAKHLN